MTKLSLVISLLCGTTFMQGCTSTTAASRNWTIEPFQAIQHGTNRPDGYYRLGRYYQGQNRLAQAAEAYQKALAINPDYAEAHNGLGTIYATQGKFELALAEFNKVMALAPVAAHSYNNLGYLHFLEGNYSEAVNAFTQATNLDPGNQKARNNLSMALAKFEEPMKPSQNMAQTIDNSPLSQAQTQNNPVLVSLPKEAGRATVEPIPPTVHTNVATVPADMPLRKDEAQRDSANTGSDKPHARLTAQEATESSLPAVRESIAPTSPVKPGGHVVMQQVSISTNEGNLPTAVKPAQPTNKPPFAILAESNPKAMPVVLISGEPVSSKAASAKSQPLPAAKVLPAVNNNAVRPNMPAAVIAAEKNAPPQLTTTSSRTVDSKAAPIKSASRQTSSHPTEKRHFLLEVSNGNGIRHFAARFSSMLFAKGLPKASLSNQASYNQARTVIQYRKGYLFEAARLSRHLRDFQHLAFVVESKGLPSNTDVKLILGKDLSGKMKQIDDARLISLASR